MMKNFRATKDLDMVLIVEAQTKEFAQRFWEFIQISARRLHPLQGGDELLKMLAYII